jgi:hypothetical protein
MIYNYNVMGYKNGKIGAVNGMRPDGKVDKTCLQSVEVSGQFAVISMSSQKSTKLF